MTVGQLKELLEDKADELEVRIMTQSNYPLENELDGLWTFLGDEDDEEKFEPADHEDDAPVLYLVEGRQLGYGTAHAWRDCEKP